MGTHWKGGGYSATVRLTLVIDGEKLEIGSIGPNEFSLRDRRDIPPQTLGDVLIQIDENVETIPVRLHAGASRDECRVEYSDLRPPRSLL